MVWYYREHNVKVFHQSEFWCWEYDRFQSIDLLACLLASVRNCKCVNQLFFVRISWNSLWDIGFMENRNQDAKTHKSTEISYDSYLLLVWGFVWLCYSKNINLLIQTIPCIIYIYLYQKFADERKKTFN